MILILEKETKTKDCFWDVEVPKGTVCSVCKKVVKPQDIVYVCELCKKIVHYKECLEKKVNCSCYSTYYKCEVCFKFK